MAVEKIQDPVLSVPVHGATFRRAGLDQEFGADNDDHRSAPIRDGITEEGSPMRIRIGQGIQHDPKNQQTQTHEAEGMKV